MSADDLLAGALAEGPSDVKVGAQLRGARERQGLALGAVARSLRIPEKTLRALEEGEFSSLPADVYVRGFLRQYAAVLGLDPVPLLRAFAVERARFPTRAAAFPWMLSGSARGGVWDAVTPRVLAAVAGGAGLLLVLFYVLFQVRTYTRAPRLEVLEPPQDLEVREPTVTLRGRTDATAEVSINGERTAVRPDGDFEETIGVGEGVNTLRVVARSIGGRETTVVREALFRPEASDQQPGAGPESGDRRLATGVGPFSLTVRAEEEAVWVQLTVDGTVAFSGLLLPASERTVSGDRIAVTSGKAAQTVIRIEGHEPTVLAPDVPGLLRDILFTKDPKSGIIERVQPSPLQASPRP